MFVHQIAETAHSRKLAKEALLLRSYHLGDHHTYPASADFPSGLRWIVWRKLGGNLFKDLLTAVESHLGVLTQRCRGGNRQVLRGQVCLHCAVAEERRVLQHPPAE